VNAGKGWEEGVRTEEWFEVRDGLGAGMRMGVQGCYELKYWN